MCDTCGCGDPEVIPVDIQADILAGNNVQAEHNREHFVEAGVLAVNLMGSPGAGKTAVLEATARVASGRRFGALAGDLATDRDAARLAAAGIASLSITTGSACHLDARMVHRALHDLPIAGLDVQFIENVGNLVCPAIYDLGHAANVVALAVTEGEDKPLKYPVMFRRETSCCSPRSTSCPISRSISPRSRTRWHGRCRGSGIWRSRRRRGKGWTSGWPGWPRADPRRRGRQRGDSRRRFCARRRFPGRACTLLERHDLTEENVLVPLFQEARCSARRTLPSTRHSATPCATRGRSVGRADRGPRAERGRTRSRDDQGESVRGAQARLALPRV